MEWTGLPSLNSLRAFSAVAETGSYSQAARQLNVTQAAVSQQVKSLEARLGVSLVVRVGRGITLTSEGAAWRVTSIWASLPSVGVLYR